MVFRIWMGVVVSSVGLPALAWAHERPAIDYNRDIRPILSDRCFLCHGPDEAGRRAGLRLDERDAVLSDRPGRPKALVPGNADASEIMRRLDHVDESKRMPPRGSGLSVSDEEKALVRQWIEEGAEYANHWAFEPIRRPSVPAGVHPVDFFVEERLEEEGVKASAPANPRRQLYRLFMDLTGLPPDPEEADRFEASPSEDAWKAWIDELMSRVAYGERMASEWLDVARYADTYGYQADVYRAVWPYRDWVVRAFQENLPFDEFITWQIAGDLLEDPTEDQRLATAFQRLHRQTNEGGSVEEEYRLEYVADRTQTFGTAFLGLTLECAKCHDHKFDPVTQREFYQLTAFFNSIDESGLYSHFTNATPTPALALYGEGDEERLRGLEQTLAQKEAELASMGEKRREAFLAWRRSDPSIEIPGRIGEFSFEGDAERRGANGSNAEKPAKFFDGPRTIEGVRGQGILLSGEDNINFPGVGEFVRSDPFTIGMWMSVPDVKDRAVVWHRSRAWTDAGSRGYQLLIEDGRLSASLIHFWPGDAVRVRAREPLAVKRWAHVAVTYDGSSRADGLAIYVDGRRAEVDVVRDGLKRQITGGGNLVLTIGQRFRDRGFKEGRCDELHVFDRELSPLEVAHLYDGVALSHAWLAPDDPRLFETYLQAHDEEMAHARESLRAAREERDKFVDSIPTIMTMKETPQPRTARILNRGLYTEPGEPVKRDVLAALPPFPVGEPRNRLGLARWLTSKEHPLTARVTVNRVWQMFFGRGLVETAEDFGSQGALPSHPRLLDWLSRELIDSGWDLGGVVRTLLTSRTYRRSSRGHRALDPENSLLSRGPSGRLPSEMIRDRALRVSGLLVDEAFGPPVKPYQPAGLWKEKSGHAYAPDKGRGLYRRSLYTIWKRTSPPPSMMIFDAAKRDVCQTRRQATNTPLQTLVLWNDPQFVEAARFTASRVLAAAGPSAEEQIAFAVKLVLGRAPHSDEKGALERIYFEAEAAFESEPERATSYLSLGDGRVKSPFEPSELAAMALLVNTLFSHDEFVTKR